MIVFKENKEFTITLNEKEAFVLSNYLGATSFDTTKETLVNEYGTDKLAKITDKLLLNIFFELDDLLKETEETIE